ncbi:alpha-glucosidase [Brevundimonas sp. Leaf363]|uniref:glycoside hydrolase family 97 protein n=1 Tax=Brevundimonas sp. Leaf363 TaxID=1736353 RepID=UPI000700988E|nr:glycoside hydrolase family 97 protein [Brevundimonas sp. Leaf363]KQS55342.1 alpha-glucosidase [Brevundimonas sp. Leaf363]
MRTALLLSTALLSAAAATAVQAETFAVVSPDGRVRLDFAQQENGAPTYAVSFDGKPVLAPSGLGLTLETGGQIGANLQVAGSTERRGDDHYTLLGKASEVRQAYVERTVEMSEPSGGQTAPRQLTLTFRAYDDGVAFRVSTPNPGPAPISLRAENTQFSFVGGETCWGLNLGRVNSSHEGEYDPVPAARLRATALYDAPLMCQRPDGPAFAIAEADLTHYAGMYLSGRGDGEPGVEISLAPHPADRTVAVRTRLGAPLTTPWRVVMVGERPGDLIESTLVANLNPDPEFDASWVKPGRSAWDWWNGGQLDGLPNSGMNTETFKRFIDFAAEHHLEYVMIDEGWYIGAGGGGIMRPGVDITRTVPDMDIPALVAYGREKGVRLWLWLNWMALEAQFDDALDQYEKWGIAGIKVDFMDRDDQPMVDWFHRLLGQAADHHLMVDLHGAYHPTGLYRTYPNFLTQEGVMGAEYNKWSSRVTATHNVTLPYTRMLVGPMDYTGGGFNNVRPQDFEHRFLRPTVMTTRAHNLAMFVVYDSPLAIVADSPDVYAGQPEMPFIDAVPTVWDETRFITGEVGQSIVLARRKGRDWWVGAMNNEEAKTVSVPLDFLGAGRFQAQLYTDGAQPTDTVRETRAVASTDTLTLSLAGSGGAAIRITRR